MQLWVIDIIMYILQVARVIEEFVDMTSVKSENFKFELTEYDSDILLKHFTQKSFHVSPLPESQTHKTTDVFYHFRRHLWRLLHDV